MADRPRPRAAKVAVITFGTVLLLPIVMYLVLLAAEAYSAHQASVALTRLESLKIGDPVSSYDRAVSDFAQSYGSQVLIAGAFRLADPALARIWASDQALGNEIRYLFDRSGLRFWQLRASSSSQDGKLTRVSLGLMVVGRSEMLGSGWTLVPEITNFHGWTPQVTLTDEFLRAGSTLPATLLAKAIVWNSQAMRHHKSSRRDKSIEPACCLCTAAKMYVN